MGCALFFPAQCQHCADIYEIQTHAFVHTDTHWKYHKLLLWENDTAVIISNSVIINSIDSSGYHSLFIGKSFSTANVCDCIQNRSWIPMMRWSERQFLSYWIFTSNDIEHSWQFELTTSALFIQIDFAQLAFETKRNGTNHSNKMSLVRYLRSRCRSIGSQTMNIAWIICILLLKLFKLFKLFHNFRK